MAQHKPSIEFKKQFRAELDSIILEYRNSFQSNDLDNEMLMALQKTVLLEAAKSL